MERSFEIGLAGQRIGGGKESDPHIRKLSWYKDAILKNSNLDVLPEPRFRSRYSWLNTPRRYLVWEVTLDGDDTPQNEWLDKLGTFMELWEMDNGGRVLLYVRIIEDQEKRFKAERAAKLEADDPIDTDTELEDF